MVVIITVRLEMGLAVSIMVAVIIVRLAVCSMFIMVALGMVVLKGVADIQMVLPEGDSMVMLYW